MDDGQFTVVSTPLPPFFFSRLLSSRGKEFVPRMAGLQKKIKDSPSPVLLILPAASICSSISSVSTTTSVQWTLFITQPQEWTEKTTGGWLKKSSCMLHIFVHNKLLLSREKEFVFTEVSTTLPSLVFTLLLWWITASKY